MATGIVVGLSRYRDTWDSAIRRSDDLSASKPAFEAQLSIMSSSGQHRSYSDASASPGRLRLPPISNLIEGVERPDRSYRPSYQGSQVQSVFQSGLPHGRLPPTSPNPTVWSPDRDARRTYRLDPPQQYEPYPVSDPTYAPNDYYRPSMALPQMLRSDARHHSSHVIDQLSSDPLSPDTHAAAKVVVREEEVPGKGPCFVYDDGTVCQKFINGDTVNPKWGTTKAGKPRKRLGQACNTCREKKIKCDPSFPKCTQCQKFGRECRFEAPSRTATKSPKMHPSGSPSATPVAEDSIRIRRPSVALTEASSQSESGTISSRAAGTVDDSLSPLTNDSNFLSDAPGPSKRARLSQVESETMFSRRTNASLKEPSDGFALEIDPFKVNKKLTETYLASYFTYIDNPLFSLVPERLFHNWAEHAEDKSQGTILVLYCMLALGCSFSKNAEKAAHARDFASIALEGIKQSFGYFSIQLIQARVIYALYEFQNGKEEHAWDLCGAAMRTACAMNLNTEEGIAQQLRDQLRENNATYGLDETRLAECMRRTFWAAYTMDSLGVACLCITTSFSKADCFLRLPCTKQAYETGVIPTNPLFDGEIQPVKSKGPDESRGVGTLSYMMQIASLCCNVRVLAFRANHQANHDRQKRYSTARNDIENQLRIWNENYLAHIHRKFYQKSSLHTEYPFSFGGLHLVYHYACMQLYRNVSHSQLSRSQASEHAQMAYYHAERTLAIAEQFTSRKSQEICDYHFAVGSPISGYAIHYAIDILSAAGINAKVLENQSPVLGLIINSVQLLDSLADVWHSAKLQQRQVSDRIRLVMHSANAGIAEGKIGFCMEESMVTTMNKEEDLVYGIGRMQYLRSFAWADQIQSASDINTVSGRGKRGSYSIWKY